MNNDGLEAKKTFSISELGSSSSSSSSNNNNNNTVSQSANLLTDCPTSRQKEIRTPVSFKCKPGIHRNFKKFCANLERQEQECFEIAMQDFMLKYQHLIGDRPVFNLVGQKDLGAIKETCTITGCNNPRAGRALYLPRKEEHFPCSSHLAEIKNYVNRQQWRILQ